MLKQESEGNDPARQIRAAMLEDYHTMESLILAQDER